MPVEPKANRPWLQYWQDYDERMTPMNVGAGGTLAAITWPALLQPYIKSPQVFQCPSDTRPTTATMNSYWAYGLQNSVPPSNFHSSYVYNDDIGGVYNNPGTPVSQAAISSVSSTIMVFDGATTVVPGTNPTLWVQKGGAQFGTDATLVNVNGEDAYGGPQARPLETAVVLYADGHVKAQRVDRFYNATAVPLGAGAKIPCMDITRGCQ